MAGGEQLEQDVEEGIVVGAGIAGLATALALWRVGRRCIVLERHAELRATGAAITLLPNAWCALRALGIAGELTSVYNTFQISRVTNLATGVTNDVVFAGATGRKETEVRPVHRKALLEALAAELPPGTIKFSSRVVTVEESISGGVSVLLDDGRVLRTKLLVGCDGVHSAVARWLGLSKTIPSGRSAVRGLAVFPGGHRLPNLFRQFLAPGLRAGIMPVTDNDLYWFLVNDTLPDSAEQELAGDPKRVLEEVTARFCKDFPEEYLSVVRSSDLSTVTWAPMEYRSPWNILTASARRGAVTVAGDAYHPMTPDLAQGGCTALEDAVGLARCLAGARTAEDGVAAYVGERRRRAAWVVGGSLVCGWVQQGGVGLRGAAATAVKCFRDRLFYPFVFPWLAASMRFDCGPLPPP